MRTICRGREWWRGVGGERCVLAETTTDEDQGCNREAEPGPIAEPTQASEPNEPLMREVPQPPGGPRTVGLGRRVIGGLMSSLAQNAVARVLSLLNQLLLVLFLKPADFGLVGLTYSITAVATAAVNIGLDDVILQRRHALQLWAGSLFWISLALSTGAAIIVAAVSPIFAHIYDAPNIVGLTCLIAIQMPIGALSTVPATILRAQLRFSLLALYTGIELAAQVLMTVGLAWAGCGAWSLVIPLPVLVTVRAVIYWIIIGSIPLKPRVKRWRFLFRNASSSSVTRMLIALIAQGGYLILGLIADKSVVGIYYFAFRLSAQPLWVLAGNFANVLFPVFTRMNKDLDRQRSATLRAATNLSFLVMPLAFLQSAVAPSVMTLFFSQEWAPSIPIVQILSVGLAFDALSWIAETLLRSRGEFRRIMHYTLIQTPVFFLLITPGAWLGGATGTAVAVGAFYLITQPIFVCVTLRRLNLAPRDIIPLYVLPTLLSGIAFGLGYVASLPFSAPIAAAAVCTSVGCSLYAMLVAVFAPAAWSELRNVLAMISRLRS